MSADTPIIVPFEDTDLPELISIVERVWYLDGDESKETSRSLATIDISYYIGVQLIVLLQNTEIQFSALFSAPTEKIQKISRNGLSLKMPQPLQLKNS